MEIPLLKDILVVFGMSVAMLLVCNRLGIPTLVGLLLTGLLAGPHGLGLIDATHEVEMLAEIGVVLLLFTIGIEFSLTTLFEIKRLVIVGGLLQVGLTTGAAILVGSLLGYPIGLSIFLGFLLTLSSTAIVLTSLQERSQIESPHGRASLAILIFQDIIVVPMMLVVPLLAGESDQPLSALLPLLGKGALVIALVPVFSKFIVPKLLHQIARTRSRELFVLSAVLVCFAIAWLTSSIGLSLGLGAFLAGLIVSESEYSHQALGGILPFRDIFTSLFFVSIGMLLDLKFVAHNALLVTAVVLSVLIGKAFLGGLVAAILRFSLRACVMVGIALGQIGEFAFVLAASGSKERLLQGDLYQLFLATSVLTMAATPFLMQLSPKLAALAMRLPIPHPVKEGRLDPASQTADGTAQPLENHLVIIGYGVNGKNIARAARVASIPYTIIEMNPDTVREERKKGLPVMYGDATYEAVLVHAQIASARAVAVVINDPIATRRIIQTVRSLNRTAYVIVRTRFIREIEPLREIGATEVVPEEFETSIEIFSRVLARYMVPREQIEKFINEVRRDEYEMFRTMNQSMTTVQDLVANIPDMELEVLQVSEDSAVAGKSLAEIDLRKNFGITLLEIRRGNDVLLNPAGDEVILSGDVLVVMGELEKRSAFAERYLQSRNGKDAN